MQLGLLVALVAAIVISEMHRPSRWRPTVAAVPGAGRQPGRYTAGGSVRRAIARAIDDDQDHRLTWLRAFARSSRSIWLPGWLSPARPCLRLGWPQLVRYNWGLDQIILVKDL